AGVVISAVRWTLGWQATRRLVHRATANVPVEVLVLFDRMKELLRFSRPVRLLLSSRIDGPAAIGWLRPVVLLPMSAITGLNPDQLRAVLAHELAHIRRHDFLVNVLQRCVESLLFYHPLVWWLSARIRSERENCCDDLAVQVCGDAMIYAQALVELEDARSKTPALALAAAGHGVKDRVLRLFGHQVEQQDWREGITAVIIVVTLLVAGAWQSTPMRAQTAEAPPMLQPLKASIVPMVQSAAPTRILVAALAGLISPEPIVQTQRPPLKASIEGVVVSSQTGAPIAGARITLLVFGAGANPSLDGVTIENTDLFREVKRIVAQSDLDTASLLARSLSGSGDVVSDSQGRFTLSDLEAGNYRLSIAANGFVRQEYGQRVFPGQGIPIVLTTGQSLKDVSIPMIPAGNVTGRIQDANGRPAVGASVQLLHAVFNSAGQKSFQSVGSGKTDDRGEYRIYWVTPGRYYVAAGSSPSSYGGAIVHYETTSSTGPITFASNTGSSPNEVAGERYPMIFYPGASDVTAGSVIEVPSGADLSGVDFLLPRPQPFRVRGRLVDANSGQPPSSATVFFIPRTLTGLSAATVTARYDSAAGTFEVPSVAPGEYVVQAMAGGGGGRGAASATGAGASAQAAVSVVNSDIDGIQLTLSAGTSINGRLTIEGIGVLPLPVVNTTRIQLKPSINGVLTTASLGLPPTPNPDGTFVFPAVRTGEYRFGLLLWPVDYYVKEARFNQIDILNNPMQFSESSAGTMEITLSPKTGRLEGTVNNARRQPAPGVRVVLIPDLHRDRSELFRNAATDQNGHFSLRGLAPGDYKIYAWESIEDNAWFDPDLIKKYEPQGQAIHVTESSDQTIDVRITAGQ
ncbi:MAG TPA: M56 family metallopeptidase, partial [Terriglobia bacterium]|nr:M56 family metallopeptidase [Terriglobia bacterium]